MRRKTGWTTGPRGRLTITSETIALFSVGIVGGGDGRTLIRTRGELLAYITATDNAAGGFARIAVGIALVNPAAFAVGATAMPGPITDANWDGWLWYKTFALFTNTAFTLPSNDGPSSARFEVDSKAMRKWKSEDAVVGVAEAETEIGTTTFKLELNTRLLEKLP